ncbi:TPA_asm: hypothetical protein GYP43_03010 [Listeria monocytogenes]|nr:hypothetical protein [Listeria monocytogenes]
MNEYVKSLVVKRIMQLERESIIDHHQESNWYASLPETQELSALKHFLRTNDQDEEYVKLKLATYEYFREMEKMKHLKDWRGLIKEVAEITNVYQIDAPHISYIKFEKKKFESIVQEALGANEAKIRWGWE